MSKAAGELKAAVGEAGEHTLYIQELCWAPTKESGSILLANVGTSIDAGELVAYIKELELKLAKCLTAFSTRPQDGKLI